MLLVCSQTGLLFEINIYCAVTRYEEETRGARYDHHLSRDMPSAQTTGDEETAQDSMRHLLCEVETMAAMYGRRLSTGILSMHEEEGDMMVNDQVLLQRKGVHDNLCEQAVSLLMHTAFSKQL